MDSRGAGGKTILASEILKSERNVEEDSQENFQENKEVRKDEAWYKRLGREKGNLDMKRV
jgi:hypothetical protein